MGSASIDSNKTSTFYNEESALKIAGPGPFYPVEPNSFTDFGGDLKTVSREPINATRQRVKGTVTDLDVVAGWQEDFTQDNLARLIQGFLQASARCKPSNLKLSSATGVPSAQVSAVAAGQNFHRAAGSFITDGFKVGHIIKSRGFGNAPNNFVWVASAVSATDITVTPTDSIQLVSPGGVASVATSALVDEIASNNGIIEAVGFQLPSGSTTLVGVNALNTPQLQLVSTTLDFTTFGFVPGEYIYIGDVTGNAAAGHNFLSDGTNTPPVRGYARIAKITITTLYLDVTVLDNFSTATGTAPLTGTLPNIYFGTVIQNEGDPTLIVRRTYTLLRTLDHDINSQPIYEYVTGAVPNQLTLNIATNNKIVSDLTFVACDTHQTSDAPVGATFGTVLNQPPYNTSQDVFVQLLYVNDPTQPEQVPLFGYATDQKLTIANNIKPNKAIGVVGAFEVTTGMLDVSGTTTCYFDDPGAIKAIRNNGDVGLLNIFAKKLQGFLFDVPEVTLGGGKLKVVKDTPIMADITQTAAAGINNTTLLYNKFEYLPASAMADYTPLTFLP